MYNIPVHRPKTNYIVSNSKVALDNDEKAPDAEQQVHKQGTAEGPASKDGVNEVFNEKVRS